MSDKEILEGNKLIAEFMNGKWEKDDYDDYGYHFQIGKQPTIHSSCWWSAEALQYHSSWDWLMPVVEKIGDTSVKSDNSYNPGYRFRIEIVNGYTQINGADKTIYSITSRAWSMLNATYKCVIEFIKWYNSKQTPQP